MMILFAVSDSVGETAEMVAKAVAIHFIIDVSKIAIEETALIIMNALGYKDN